MKHLRMLLLLVFLAILTAPVTAQTVDETKPESLSTQGVQVYYFHYTRRCATCISVEEESRRAVQELYGDRVIFDSFNLEDKQGEKMGETLGVSGQTLLIVSGDKRIDITNQGFLYAGNDPEKLKQVIKDKIDPLL